jgi:hypothetical protein
MCFTCEVTGHITSWVIAVNHTHHTDKSNLLVIPCSMVGVGGAFDRKRQPLVGGVD